MSEDMPEDMSEYMPEDMSEYMPEDMSDRMPEDMSEYMPEDMPDRMPEDMSDRVPEDMPDRMPEDLPDRMPEDMPDHMPEDMPDRMSEDMSDRMPEDLPVRKCINVMVGITRSKVIFLDFFRLGNVLSYFFCFVSDVPDRLRRVSFVPVSLFSSAFHSFRHAVFAACLPNLCADKKKCMSMIQKSSS